MGLSVLCEDEKSFCSLFLEKQRFCLTQMIPVLSQEYSSICAAGRMQHEFSCSLESVCDHIGSFSPCYSLPVKENQ